MNTKIIGLLVIGIVALAGIGYLLLNTSNGVVGVSSTATTSDSTLAQQTTTTKPSTTGTKPVTTKAKIVGIGSITYLIDLKQPLVCTVNTLANANIKRSGTLYVAGAKARANFVGSTMIVDNTYLYGWEAGATKGLQLLSATSASGSAIARSGGLDLITDLSFACNPWTIDMSIFLPPASVTFYNTL